MDRPLTYRDAGVDVEGKARLLERVGEIARATLTPAASGWGAFAGTMRLPSGETIAVTTDGVGTKTILARACGRDCVVGGDVVAHCANDLVCAGARPLLFVDYVAMPALDAPALLAIVEGMAAACRDLGIPLLGGETAEMPGVYREGACDVVGTMVGVVERAPEPPRPRDVAIGLASTGLHTNGYSLARALVEGLDLDAPVEELGATLADALLAPHRCYAPSVLALGQRVTLRGVAHVTGGGLPGNLERILPPGAALRLDGRWPRPAIFEFLRRRGRLDEREMRRAFNLGLGMVVVVAPPDAAAALALLRERGEEAWPVGEIVTPAGGERVVFE